GPSLEHIFKRDSHRQLPVRSLCRSRRPLVAKSELQGRLEGEGPARCEDRIDTAPVTACRIARALRILFVEEVLYTDTKREVFILRRRPLRIDVDDRVGGLVVETARGCDIVGNLAGPGHRSAQLEVI